MNILQSQNCNYGNQYVWPNETRPSHYVAKYVLWNYWPQSITLLIHVCGNEHILDRDGCYAINNDFIHGGSLCFRPAKMNSLDYLRLFAWLSNIHTARHMASRPERPTAHTHTHSYITYICVCVWSPLLTKWSWISRYWIFRWKSTEDYGAEYKQ